MSAWIYNCMSSMDCVNKICSIDAILPMLSIPSSSPQYRHKLKVEIAQLHTLCILRDELFTGHYIVSHEDGE